MIWLLGGYLWLYVHRPFEIWPFLGTLRVERMYAIGMISLWAVNPRKSFSGNRLHFAFLFFAFAILVSWTGSPFPSALGGKICEDFGKVFIIYLLLTTSIQNESDFRKILMLFFLAMFIYQAHSLLEFANGKMEVRMNTIRMRGVDTTHGDPNSFAGSLLYVLPFLVPFWESARASRTRQLVSGYVLLTLLCVFLTGSRRAFLGVIVLTGWVMIRTRHKMLLILILLLCSPIVWALMRDDLQNRFLTLIDKSYGPENAYVSGISRYYFFLDSLELFNQYPITGVGPAGFRAALDHHMQPHNLFAQLMSELGILGIIAFLLIVHAFWRNAVEVRSIYRQRPYWQPDFLYYVSQVSWIAVLFLMFMGLGGHNLYHYTWLWFGAFQSIAVKLVRQRAAAHVPLTTANYFPGYAQPVLTY